MIEEPYRWVEAIQNRREYIEHQLAVGSPIACLSCAEGVLLLTVGRERQKIFEIYDRIAMGAIGHPGDIERLRMAAIEVASTEGFTRSAHDVSLRRLSSYSLSPALKTAFEQIYGPPYLARMIFAELGRREEPDFFVRLDYDGSFHTNGSSFSKEVEPFAVISGKTHSTVMMEKFLKTKTFNRASFAEAVPIALDAWTVGHIALTSDSEELPTADAIAKHREEQLQHSTIEAAVMEREAKSNITYRPWQHEARPELVTPAAPAS